MEVFATFDIIDQSGNRVAEGHKASFCLEDNQCLPGVEPRFVLPMYKIQFIVCVANSTVVGLKYFDIY